MTKQELAKIELAEFRGALAELMESDAFVRLLVPWAASLRDLKAQGPVTPDRLEVHNFVLGRASVPQELLDEIEAANPGF